jgi:hypothetical protein
MNDFNVRLPSSLRADCSRCAGLCCVVHSFSAVQGFGFDKAAHSPCRHLTCDNQCAIHPELLSRGFPGCIAFDCYGAGQRVTQDVMNGASWRASRELALRVFAAYEAYLVLHRLMAALALAEAVLAPTHAASLSMKRAELDELCRSQAARSGTLNLTRIQSDVLELIHLSHQPSSYECTRQA